MATPVLDLSTQLSANVQPFNTAMDQSASKAGAAFSQMKDYAAAYLGTRGLLHIFSEATRSSNEFGQQMADLSAITELNMKKIKDSIIDLPNYFGDVTKIANTMYEIVSSGFRNLSEDELVRFQKAVSVSSKVIRADVYNTGNAMTTIANAYQLSLEDVEKLQDWFYLTVREGKAHSDELARTLGLVINNAAEAGISLNDLGGAVAILSRTQSTSQAMIGLNQLINGLIGPTLEAQATAKKWGVEIGAAALEAKGFTGVLAELHEKVGGNVEALKGIFGNIRAARAALSLTGGQFKSFLAVLQEYDKGHGTGMEAFLKQIDTAQNSFERLGVQAEKTLITIGDDLRGASAGAAGLGEALLKGFADSGPITRYTTYIIALNYALEAVRRSIDSIGQALNRATTAATASQMATQRAGAVAVAAVARPSQAAILGRYKDWSTREAAKLGGGSAARPNVPIARSNMDDLTALRRDLRPSTLELQAMARRNMTERFAYMNVTSAGQPTRTQWYDPLKGKGSMINYQTEFTKEMDRLRKSFKTARMELEKSLKDLPEAVKEWERRDFDERMAAFRAPGKGNRTNRVGLTSSQRYTQRFGFAPNAAWYEKLSSRVDKTIGKVANSAAAKFTSGAISVIGKTAMTVGGIVSSAIVGWNIGKAIAERFDFKNTKFFESLQNTTIGGILAGLVSGDFRKGRDVTGVEAEISEYNMKLKKRGASNAVITSDLPDAEKHRLLTVIALATTEAEAIRANEAVIAALNRRKEELDKANNGTRQEQLAADRVKDAEAELAKVVARSGDAAYRLTKTAKIALGAMPEPMTLADATKRARAEMEAAGLYAGDAQRADIRKYMKDKGLTHSPDVKATFGTLRADALNKRAEQIRSGYNSDKTGEGIPRTLVEQMLKDDSAKSVLDNLKAMLDADNFKGELGGVTYTKEELNAIYERIIAVGARSGMGLGSHGAGGGPSAEQINRQLNEVTETAEDAVIARMQQNFVKLRLGLDKAATERDTRYASDVLADIRDQSDELEGTMSDVGRNALERTRKEILDIKKELDDLTGHWASLESANKEAFIDVVKRSNLTEEQIEKLWKKMQEVNSLQLKKVGEHGESLLNKLQKLKSRADKDQKRLDKIESERIAGEVETYLDQLYNSLGAKSVESMSADLLQQVRNRLQYLLDYTERNTRGESGEQKQKGELIIRSLGEKLKDINKNIDDYDRAVDARFKAIADFTKNLDSRGKLSNTALYHSMTLTAGTLSSFYQGMGGKMDYKSLRYANRNDGARVSNAQEAQSRLGVLMDTYNTEQKYKQAELFTTVKQIKEAIVARQPLFLR